MRGTLYLAGPIDELSDMTPGVVEYRNKKEVIKSEAIKRGWMVYDPAWAWAGRREADGPEIWRANHAAMHNCEAIVAIVPAGINALGTGMEIEWAIHHRGGCVVWTNNTRSWSLHAPKITRMPWSHSAVKVVDAVEGQTENRRSGYAESLRVSPAGGGEAILPTRGYHGDAGFDLYVSEDTVVNEHGFTDVHCGVAVEFPDGVWGLIVGRSSTIRKRELLVTPGIIDQGFRGELYTGVWNLSGQAQMVQKGERLAQIIPMPVVADHLIPEMVDSLGYHPRGVNGFGSTGH